MSNQPYAFISYSSKEYAEANNVRDVLNTNGVSCWMAPQSIEGGSMVPKGTTIELEFEAAQFTD